MGSGWRSGLLLVIFTCCYTIQQVSSRDNLSCYQCLARSSLQCTSDDLKTCPKDQAYDHCKTVIKKTASDGYLVEKGCALAPCMLRSDANRGLGLDQTCDTSKPEFYCMECCKGDGCNKEGGTVSLTTTALTLIIVGLLLQLGLT